MIDSVFDVLGFPENILYLLISPGQLSIYYNSKWGSKTKWKTMKMKRQENKQK